jgi:uncharacterized alkaline shock family protein YloU
MRPENNIDLGAIQVHKRVIADICTAAVGEVDGVAMARNVMLEDVCGIFGARRNSAVSVRVDAGGQVSVVLKVLVRYGVNLSDVSRRIQEVVMTAVERTADINLKDVDVNIQGVERG